MHVPPISHASLLYYQGESMDAGRGHVNDVDVQEDMDGVIISLNCRIHASVSLVTAGWSITLLGVYIRKLGCCPP